MSGISGIRILDPRVSTPIEAISPATAADGSAPAMQHMGVLRDFLVPGETEGEE